MNDVTYKFDKKEELIMALRNKLKLIHDYNDVTLRFEAGYNQGLREAIEIVKQIR